MSRAIEERLEKITTDVFSNRDKASKHVAQQLASLIKERNKLGRHTVIGLATGSTPLLVYKELIRMHKEDRLSFKNVITFNLDEYYPISREDRNSYFSFMNENLFSHIDILPENIHIPDGTLPVQDVDNFCINYDNKILSLGGIDIQILGIGRNGHIGFNEPGSQIIEGTRLIDLNPITIEDAALAFGGTDFVPRKALTMGIKSIMQAKKIFLLAWGEGKAEAIRDSVEGPITSSVSASYLQKHKNTIFILDTPAASRLSRFETPWLINECDWDDNMIKRALIWLSKQVDKSILKLTDNDYKSNGLISLLQKFGNSYNLNIEVHNHLHHTITGWPGGRPGDNDKTRPERANPFPKKIVVFSPHPDDDVISMGGTLIRLADQGHEVHVAYQTSGSIGVSDDEALRYIEFINRFSNNFNIAQESINSTYEDMIDFLSDPDNSGNDHPDILKIKSLIRKVEATAASRYSGIKEENIHFLDLPFYKTGKIEKKPISDKDVDIIVNILQEIKPHQIYAAGDLQDPHGTHELCLKAITRALNIVKDESWTDECWVWLYRGTWQEWDIEDIDMAVPISPDELLRKRKAIFKHQSQKDEPIFSGNDKREFWQRAEDWNRETANMYDYLGLTEYEAMEAFKRYYFK